MTEKISEQELHQALDVVVNNILAKRKESEDYKDLFKASEHGLSSLLRKAKNDMSRIALNTTKIIANKLDVNSNDLYNLISALPYIANKLEEKITAEEGRTCCVDKTYYLLEKTIEKMLSKAEK